MGPIHPWRGDTEDREDLSQAPDNTARTARPTHPGGRAGQDRQSERGKHDSTTRSCSPRAHRCARVQYSVHDASIPTLHIILYFADLSELPPLSKKSCGNSPHGTPFHCTQLPPETRVKTLRVDHESRGDPSRWPSRVGEVGVRIRSASADEIPSVRRGAAASDGRHASRHPQHPPSAFFGPRAPHRI